MSKSIGIETLKKSLLLIRKKDRLEEKESENKYDWSDPDEGPPGLDLDEDLKCEDQKKLHNSSSKCV